MYTLFILFFISLAGIIFMVGRKLAPVRNGQIVKPEQPHPFVPELQKIKHLSYQSIRKYEHIALVLILRFYVRLVNFVKYSYQELKVAIKKIWARVTNHVETETPEEKETSKFLKIISEYKKRVKHIKHRIKEEEEMK